MLKERVLPADRYTVINKTILNDNDRKLLITLYQPIIGSEAVSLYLSLWTYLDKLELISNEWTHHHLMTNMRTKLETIVISREKLEAIGLVRTYIKKGDINNFIYELYSPLSANEFLNNPVLSVSLYNNVGKIEFEKIKDIFKIPKINLKEYEEISCNFNDIFEYTDITNFESMVDDIKQVNRSKFNIISKLDFDNSIALIPEELLNIRNITNSTKELIYNLSFIYDLDDQQMSELIRNSLTEKRTIDKVLLKQNCHKYYQFEHSGKIPSVIYKNQPEYLRKTIGDASKKAKIIYQFETTSPYDFMVSKHGGKKPTSNEIDILSYLILDMNLKPGVVNVIIDYILKESNNKLVKSFVEMVAAQFARCKIETVEDAMKLAENEHKNRTKKTTKKMQKEEKPEWFDKNIELKEAAQEDFEQMEKLLSQFK